MFFCFEGRVVEMGVLNWSKFLEGIGSALISCHWNLQHICRGLAVTLSVQKSHKPGSVLEELEYNLSLQAGFVSP
jgi:hypothetical protein